MSARPTEAAAAARRPAVSERPGGRAPPPLRFCADLLRLGKAWISAMAALTGLAGFLAATAAGAARAAEAGIATLSLFLLGLAANTLNQVLEREKDARMERTRRRRPLPAGRIRPGVAVVLLLLELAVCLLLLGVVLARPLAAALALATFLYYGLLYTLVLKPRHHTSVVTGGVPGAMGPVIGWAAAGAPASWTPLWLFLLILLWTPPHAYALSIYLKDDYARAGIPVLPVVRGVDETARQVLLYALLFVPFSVAAPFLPEGFAAFPCYVPVAVLLGAWFLVRCLLHWRRRPLPDDSRALFRLSLLHLGALFAAILVDLLVAR